MQSVREQSFPNKEIIVVVDHNPLLHASLAAALPDVTVVENREERGLSGGKNTGVVYRQGRRRGVSRRRCGRRPGLAEVLRRLLRRSQPSSASVASPWPTGRSRVRPGSRPSSTGWSAVPTAGCPNPVRQCVTSSAATRHSAGRPSDLAGGFQNGIGRSAGKRPLGCEETEFCIRLQSAVARIGAAHRRAGDDLASGARRSLPILLLPRRCYAEGLSKALVTASVGTRDGLSAERRYTTRTLPMGVARGLGLPARRRVGAGQSRGDHHRRELHGGGLRRGLGNQASATTTVGERWQAVRRGRPRRW